MAQSALFEVPAAIIQREHEGKGRKVGETTGRVRDCQRSRVYEAERRAFPQFQEQIFESEALVLQFVERVVGSGWFIERFGVQLVEVRFRGGQNARGCPSGWIELPPWAFNPWVILHELAHVVAPGEEAGHGPEFCSIYLELVRHVLGERDHYKLAREFLIDRVKHHSGSAVKSGEQRRKDLVRLRETLDKQKADLERRTVEVERREMEIAKQARSPVSVLEASATAQVIRRAIDQGLLGGGAAGVAEKLEKFARLNGGPVG